MGLLVKLSACEPKKDAALSTSTETSLTKLTADIIGKTKDEELEQVVVDDIQVNVLNDGSEDRERVASLTPGQRAVYVTWMVEAEVNNGGFNQFYYNSSGQLADFGEESFKAIGAPKLADLVHEANTIYAEIKDDLEKYNDGTVEGFSKSYENNPLNRLDSKFYKLYEEEPVGSLRVKFIRDNVNQFVGK
jgi:hypothetical protein